MVPDALVGQSIGYIAAPLTNVLFGRRGERLQDRKVDDVLLLQPAPFSGAMATPAACDNDGAVPSFLNRGVYYAKNCFH